MGIYKAITTDNDHLILDASKAIDKTGSIHSVTIVNKSTTLTTNIKLNVRDTVAGGNPVYTLAQFDIPPNVTLLLQEEMLMYNSKRYQLKLITLTAGGDANLDLTIKRKQRK